MTIQADRNVLVLVLAEVDDVTHAHCDNSSVVEHVIATILDQVERISEEVLIRLRAADTF